MTKQIRTLATLCMLLLSAGLIALDVSDAISKTGINSAPIPLFGFGQTPGYLVMPIPIVDPTIGNSLALASMFTS